MMATSDDKLLERAKKRFKLAHDQWAENRRWYSDDILFAQMGEQWPEKYRKEREAEGRPCLTINRVTSFGRQIVNDARQNKPTIKVRPADSKADVKTANIYNGLVRNIEQQSSADVCYDTALECAVYGGFGFFRIDTEYAHDDTFDLDICFKRINNPLTVYPDPASTAADASDWRFCFVTEMMAVEDFERQYGKNVDKHDWSADGDEEGALWFEEGEQRIRVAEYWEREEVARPIVLLTNGQVIDRAQFEREQMLWDAQGITVAQERETQSFKVTHYLMTGSEILESTEWAGRYIPVVPVYGNEVVRDGRRYFRSMTSEIRDAQMMYNFWRTASTELVALAPKAPFIGPKGAFDSDMGKWQTAHVKSHPFIEYDGGIAPQRQAFAGVPAGALQEALNASDDMKAILGIYDASLGARSNETSGRAILARQREGDVSTFHYIDNLSRAIRYAGRVLIDLIPAVYNKPRMVRVLGEDGTPKVVGVNQPEPDPHGNVYELARGKYDLVVDTGPGYTTKREETNAFLTELIRANPATAPLLIDVVARNLDFPESEKIANRFKAMLPPPIQALEGQDDGQGGTAEVLMQQLVQAQMQMQQMQQALQQAEVQRTQLEAQKVAQSGEVEKMRLALDSQKLELEKYQADLDANVKVYVEQLKIGAQQQSQAVAMEAEDRRAQPAVDAAQSERMSNESLIAAVQEIMGGLATMRDSNAMQLQTMQALVAAANAPKQVIRDPQTGRVVGVAPAQG